MANPEHLAMLKQGIGVWNQWRQEHPEAELDFSGADLSEAILSGADLSLEILTVAENVAVVALFLLQ